MKWIQLEDNTVTNVIESVEDPNIDSESSNPWILVDGYLATFVKVDDVLSVVNEEVDDSPIVYYTIVPNNRDEFIRRLLEELTATRKTAQESLIKYNNHTFKIDETTKNEIYRRIQLMNDEETINWKSESGYVSLNKNDLSIINQGITIHLQNIFDNEKFIIDEIYATETSDLFVSFLNMISTANWYQFSSENYDFYPAIEVLDEAEGASSGESDVPDEFKPIPIEQ